MQVKTLKQCFFYTGSNPIGKQGAVRHHHCSATTGLTALPGSLEFAHNKLQKQQGGFRCLHVFGEISANTFFFLATKRRIGENCIYPVLVADFAQGEAQGVAGINARVFQTMKQQIHLYQQVGQGLGLTAIDTAVLQGFAVFDGFALLLQVAVCLHQKAASTTCGVKNDFSQSGVHNLHHKAYYGAWCVELTGVTRRIAHLSQHGFVETT